MECPRTAPRVGDYLKAVRVNALPNWSIGTINDQIVVDFVRRRENLAADFRQVTERLGISDALTLPRG